MITDFNDIRFPDNISYGAKGGPLFSTEIVSSASGHEQRNINWSRAKARYEVSTGIKGEKDIDQLIAFFKAVRGRAVGFRFKDWSDYRVSNGYIGTGDGKCREFKFVKYYTSGDFTYIRDIKKPVNNNFMKIYVDGSRQKPNDLRIDFTQGMIIFSTAPANKARIRADFEFDVPVRFDTDHLDLQIDSPDNSNWGNIALVEIRV